jgi:hypothetical protein
MEKKKALRLNLFFRFIKQSKSFKYYINFNDIYILGRESNRI